MSKCVCVCLYAIWILFSQVGYVVCVWWIHKLGMKKIDPALRTICLYVYLLVSYREIAIDLSHASWAPLHCPAKVFAAWNQLSPWGRGFSSARINACSALWHRHPQCGGVWVGVPERGPRMWKRGLHQLLSFSGLLLCEKNSPLVLPWLRWYFRRRRKQNPVTFIRSWEDSWLLQKKEWHPCYQGPFQPSTYPSLNF